MVIDISSEVTQQGGNQKKKNGIFDSDTFVMSLSSVDRNRYGVSR